MRATVPKKKKFSAFGTDKEYNTVPNKDHIKDLKDIPVFTPKEEFRKLPFDENIRHRIDQIPNHLVYRFLYNHIPQDEAQSQYVAVNKNG